MQKKERLNAGKLSAGFRLSHGLFGAFLTVTSVIAALAAITVLYPHGALVSLWSFKKAAYQQLLNIGFLAGVGFAVLFAVLALTAVGWFLHRRWAWYLSWIGLSVNLASNVASTLITRQWVNLVGAALEGLILFWLTSRPIRTQYLRMHADKRDS